jgi:rhamnogalacturonyl hydrolase YesR
MLNKTEMQDFKAKLESSLLKLERWVESHNYKAYEPADALSSNVRPLLFGNLFLERVLIQIVKQSPVNLRPILGIKPHETTIGRGYMAWGYLIMFRLTGKEAYKKKAVALLEWLLENKSPKFTDYSWGNHYDFASRSGKYSKQEPIIVWTALIGLAFLEAYELLKVPKYLEVAESVCNWILALPRERTTTGTCVSYLATKQSSIHNSNMLGAAMLARTWKQTNDNELLQVATEAMEYSVSRQLPDGAWYYGEASNQHWIDNFHTGYNLDSLKSYIESTGDRTYETNFKRGLEYYKTHFFEENGRPRYYHNRTYPVDSQCTSQAIETLANVAEYDDASLALAIKVAKWAIDTMQDEDGHFYYRQYPFAKAKVPLMHWGQATTYKGLALLLSKVTASTK